MASDRLHFPISKGNVINVEILAEMSIITGQAFKLHQASIISDNAIPPHHMILLAFT